MKKISTIILMCFLVTDIFSQQNIVDLYKYVINAEYNYYLRGGYLTEKDSLYVLGAVCSDTADIDKCDGYRIELKNNKIIFEYPDNLRKNRLISIGLPNILDNCIVISSSDYGIEYNEILKTTLYVTGGGRSYFFRYSSSRKKFIFVKKEEYGI